MLAPLMSSADMGDDMGDGMCDDISTCADIVLCTITDMVDIPQLSHFLDASEAQIMVRLLCASAPRLATAGHSCVVSLCVVQWDEWMFLMHPRGCVNISSPSMPSSSWICTEHLLHCLELGCSCHVTKYSSWQKHNALK